MIGKNNLQICLNFYRDKQKMLYESIKPDEAKKKDT